LTEVAQPSPKATYGEEMVRNALNQGAVDTLLISESVRKKSVSLKCESCQHEWQVSLSRVDALPKCPTCSTDDDSIKEIDSIDMIDDLAAMAQKSSSKMVFVSVDTEEGSILYHGFGGIAAMLRYPIG